MNTVIEIEIRSLQEKDCKEISESFSKIGWNKPESIYRQYLLEQSQGLRYCFIAECQGQFAGYITLLKKSKYEHFKIYNIPEISDLNILPEFRKKGIATKLIQKCEIEVRNFSDKVGLGVGLTSDYMNAFNLYLKLCYKLDDNGIAQEGITLNYGDNTIVNDNLNLYLIKTL